MFTMAGLNLRGRPICWAFIIPADSSRNCRRRAARLWRFASGDCAWITRTFVAWPRACLVQNLIGKGVNVPNYLREYASPLPEAT